MRKYLVFGTRTEEISRVIEANDHDEAREIFEQQVLEEHEVATDSLDTVFVSAESSELLDKDMQVVED